MRQAAKYYAILGKTTFSPLDLSPALWLDASDTSTITESSGAVSEWRDKSGNARHVSQGTAARQPLTGTRTQNDLNVIDFDGGDVLTRSLTRIDQPFTLIWVGKYDSAVSTLDVGFSVADATYGVYKINKWRMFSGVVLEGTAAADQNAHVFISVHNGSSSTYRVDGVTGATGNSGNEPTIRFAVGAANTAASSAIDGWIGEIIYCAGLLTPAQLTDVEKYLKNKWGTP